ncbi:MAG TPA: hypothetical protein VNX68_07990, partial [Nitrosopumilaceae archaeon]|nr:hypothetical protein [Nitrosopumilaceae archaeon]
AITYDDLFFIAVVKSKGILKGTGFFFEVVNGRWFSHLFTCTVFAILGVHASWYWIYLMLMMLWFVSALGGLLRSLCQHYYSFFPGIPLSFYISLTITSVLFFLLYEGRFDIWYWMSSVSMHLLSLTFLFSGFSVLLRNKKGVGPLLVMMISFIAAGGLNEIYAIIGGLLLLIFWIGDPMPGSKFSVLRIGIAFVCLFGSLAVNLLSAGILTRFSILPEFHVVQAMKNTLHTVLLPFFHYQVLPLKILSSGIFICFCVFISRSYFQKIRIRKVSILPQFIVISGIILLSFFMASYILSDIVPYRAQSMGYLILILFGGNYVLRQSFFSGNSGY